MIENIHEEWRSIKGYEGFYEISNLGRLRSLDRVSSGRRRKGQLMNPSPSSAGYLMTVFCRNGLQTGAYIHHLVAEAFIGMRPDGYDVCHNDGDRLNNRADNLRYDTRAGNFADKRKHGTSRYNPNTLTAEIVRVIKAGLKAGRKGAELAREFGVTPPTISHIKTGHTWSYVD
ncbi:HNH endonuclease [Sphingobium sp. BHU LFT2]|uniref:NUMOD4 domain-containing protein n=1 Tax=Sphingobium sp. BHU LFT2 TaxID=2807634 RepID=UPI001BE6C31B|nr:HNH endonuclease [Sphingobium sp. BHU LFT2]MBT2244586.1 HNH endonuclease [Sphingobium sp. BHU LFT2]